MEANFTTELEEDHRFLHKLARETGSGEQAWRKAVHQVFGMIRIKLYKAF